MSYYTNNTRDTPRLDREIREAKRNMADAEREIGTERNHVRDLHRAQSEARDQKNYDNVIGYAWGSTVSHAVIGRDIKRAWQRLHRNEKTLQAWEKELENLEREKQQLRQAEKEKENERRREERDQDREGRQELTEEIRGLRKDLDGNQRTGGRSRNGGRTRNRSNERDR